MFIFTPSIALDLDLYRPPVSVGLIGALLALAVGLATWGYLWRGRRAVVGLTPAWRYGLLGLRLLALAVLAWMLAGPSVVDQRPDQQTVGPTITLLVDTSASMSQSDVRAEKRTVSRLEALKGSWLAKSTLARLDENADVRMVGFDGQSQALGQPFDQAADGNQTRLIQAVLNEKSTAGGRIGDPLVVLSDGHDTQRGVDEALLKRIEQTGRPIFTVPVGRAQTSPDLAVRAWADSDFVFAGERTTIHADVHQRGLAGKPVRVELDRGGQVIATQRLTPHGPSSQTAFEVEPEAKPRKPVTLADYQVRVELVEQTTPDRSPRSSGGVTTKAETSPGPTLPASFSTGVSETYTANNTRHVFVQVSRQRINVLLLEAQPYWDTQRLARVLGDDPRINLTAVYRISAERTVTVRDSAKSASDRSSQPLPGPHQIDAEWLHQFDVIALGKGVEQFLPGNKAQLLADYVTEAGGGLVLVRGQPADVQTPSGAQTLARLDPLMPVQWGQKTLADLRVELTDAGQQSPLLGLEGSSSDSVDGSDIALTELPGMLAATRIERERAGSLVYLRQAVGGSNSQDDSDGSTNRDSTNDKTPAMAAVVSMRAGRGEVLAVLTDGLWRWDLLPTDLGEYDSMYHLFWSRAIQWLATGGRFLPGQDVSLSLDRLSVEPGRSVTARITTRYVDPADFSPVLTWIDPEGERQSLHPPSSASSDGSWQITIQPQIPGIHRLELTTPAPHNRPDLIDPQTPLQTRFAVHDRSVEQLDTSARPDLLQRLAQASGGQTLGLHDQNKLTDYLADLRTARQSDLDPRYAFAYWPVLGLIFCALGLEWFLRRRMGLT